MNEQARVCCICSRVWISVNPEACPFCKAKLLHAELEAEDNKQIELETEIKRLQCANHNLKGQVRHLKSKNKREDHALDALIVSQLRQNDNEHLPRLTEEDKVALDSLEPDFVNRLLKGER